MNADSLNTVITQAQRGKGTVAQRKIKTYKKKKYQ